MSDKELEEYFKTVDPNFNSHIEKGTIEMSNEYYNLLEERIARLINENQHLKQWDCNKDTRNSRQRIANDKLQQENKQLKEKLKIKQEVIEEVRIYIEDNSNQMSEDATYDLLQILDKGESNE